LEDQDHVLKLGNAVEKDATVGLCGVSCNHVDRRGNEAGEGSREGRLGADEGRGVGKAQAPARRSHRRGDEAEGRVKLNWNGKGILDADGALVGSKSGRQSSLDFTSERAMSEVEHRCGRNGNRGGVA
jgi:hypothetical protein